jgi:hypothetical protein
MHGAIGGFQPKYCDCGKGSRGEGDLTNVQYPILNSHPIEATLLEPWQLSSDEN